MTTPSFLSAGETRTLEAICNTLMPSIARPEREDPGGLMSRSASDLDVAESLVGALAGMDGETQARFRQLLGFMGSPLFGVLLAGRPKGFAHLPARLQERALQRMAESPIAMLRQAFQALKRPVAFIFYSAPTGGVNPNWEAIGYNPITPPLAARATPKPIRTLPVDADVQLTADAVVVGSGAGGSMVAAELAAAGKDVVVLEMGEYLNEADFTGNEAEMTSRLFLGRGLLATADLGITVLAGSCLGGAPDGADDVLIPGAAAQVALEPVADLVVGGVRVIPEQVG